jgi:signal transduction histidine kinase
VLCILHGEVARKQVRQTLEQAGFLVTEANTGLAGVAAAEAGRCDLVLVDFHLPDLEGTAVATHLRRRRAGLPIVALALPGHDHKLALSAGCDGVVDAPADLGALAGSLREFLAGKRETLGGGEETTLLKEYSEGLVEMLESKLAELTWAHARLQAIDRAKTEFVQSVASELATPLTPLSGYLHILQSERLGALNDRQRGVVDAMLQSAARLSATLDSLADFASLESAGAHVTTSAVEPVALAEAALLALHALAKGKHIVVRLKHQLPREAWLWADARRLAQAMSQLMENAVKYSPCGAEVLVELTRSGPERLRVCVYDQGAGVPRDEQARIFEPFHHTERAGAGEAGGAGLGLAVARQIVQSHGGVIGVESPPKSQPEQGRHFAGSKFFFEVRSQKDERHDEPHDPSGQPRSVGA